MVLSSTEAAAFRAFYARTQGTYKISTKVVEALMALHELRGDSLADLPWSPERDDLEAWRESVNAYLAEATVASKFDQMRFVAFLEASAGMRGANADSAQVGMLQNVMMALESSGVRIPGTAVAGLEQALASTEAGSRLAQCTDNPVLLGILYMSQNILSSESLEYLKQAFGVRKANGRGCIDVRAMREYRETMASSTAPILERAIRTESAFEAWIVRTSEALASARLPLARDMLNEVLAQARAQSHGNHALFREFAYGYFFDEFLGCGLPEVVAIRSALVVISNPSAALARVHAPTVATPFDMASIANAAFVPLVQQVDLNSLAGSSVGGSMAGSAIGSSVSAIDAKWCYTCGKVGCGGTCADARRAAGLLKAAKAADEKKKAGS